MSLWDTVEFAHMALRLVPKVLNPVDVILLVCKEFGAVESKVLEVRNIQYVVGFPAVTINNDDIMAYDGRGGVFASWALVSPEYQDGVLKFLLETMMPIIEHPSPPKNKVEALAVLAPGEEPAPEKT